MKYFSILYALWVTPLLSTQVAGQRTRARGFKKIRQDQEVLDKEHLIKAFSHDYYNDNAYRISSEDSRSSASELINGIKLISRRKRFEEEDDNDDGNAEEDDNDDGNADGDSAAETANDLCSQYLASFLEGITDAKDNCDGFQNAYVAAYCNVQSDYEEEYDDDHDDYFVNYNHFSCCLSLKNHYDSYCNESELITNSHLLLVAGILLLCEMMKSLIKSKKLHWLPEAGGCMIVGMAVGALAHILPDINLEDLSFDEDLFLAVLLPPIIFEAALSVNKKEFRRRRMAIFMFAIVGTILSTFMTGYFIHFASIWLDSVTQIPLLDCLIFGALISSIDPVAILSVLTSLNLTEEDTVFIMVFGESLLNDGVAITLFNSLISHYNSADKVDTDEILGAIADFLIIGFGSIAIGLICGFGALLYFWFLRKKLNAPMEVASFFLWAGIPYYACDELNLSGIVAIVTIGFFLDIYITSPKNSGTTIITTDQTPAKDFDISTSLQPLNANHFDLGESLPLGLPRVLEQSPSAKSSYSFKSIRSFRTLRTLNMRELLLREEKFQLSREADKHVRFCAHLLAQLSENCIFVYLGLFLFSKNYDWEFPLITVSIISCVASRAIMVLIICSLVWYINIARQKLGYHKSSLYEDDIPRVSRTASALQDRHIQLVLVLSGLRGAVSLALVESVPIYNAVTGTGTEYKGIMKAMTSASIIFTIFVLGGSSYYILRNLDIKSADERLNKQLKESIETSQELPERKKKQRPTPESPLARPAQISSRSFSKGTVKAQNFDTTGENMDSYEPPSVQSISESKSTTSSSTSIVGIDAKTSDSYDKNPTFIHPDSSFA